MTRTKISDRRRYRTKGKDWEITQLHDGTPVPPGVTISTDILLESTNVELAVTAKAGQLFRIQRKVRLTVGPDLDGQVHLWMEYWLDDDEFPTDEISLGRVGGWIISDRERAVLREGLDGRLDTLGPGDDIDSGALGRRALEFEAGRASEEEPLREWAESFGFDPVLVPRALELTSECEWALELQGGEPYPGFVDEYRRWSIMWTDFCARHFDTINTRTWSEIGRKICMVLDWFGGLPSLGTMLKRRAVLPRIKGIGPDRMAQVVKALEEELDGGE